ncbi:phosphoenolpyruvate synthase [Gordonia defluvii]|uniref:Phosphoenolpyruvate synthase n=2 Tax=Gordonia TaxID=2053 RepID=A0ABP6L8A9_9ACTN
MTDRWVRNLTELGLTDAPSVGGKGANLGELIRGGFPVPGGFVVTKEAYLHAVEAAGVRAKLAARSLPPEGATETELLAVADELRAVVRDVAVPAEIRTQIAQAYTGLGGDPRVAVRSSAPAEDAADTSFAGIHDSFTDIEGVDALVDTVVRCWMSLWSARAITYRGVQDYTDEPSVAVVVQIMADSLAAGVMFTVDPRTSDRGKVLIEAARGLGEVVVGGQVEPDTYLVDKGSRAILDVHLGAQEFQFVAGHSASEIPEEVSTRDRGTRVLTDAEVLELTQIAVGAEEHYGAPQDMEFSFCAPAPGSERAGRGERAVFIVQSRPITTLDAGPAATERQQARGEVLVTGLGASPGVASGQVRILHEVADAGALRDGDILVAPMTRPDWLPVLRRASAIVTDGGGITCHAAIVGRELGKPVVVGARGATSTLVEGAAVTVDGSTGTITAGTSTVAPPPPAAAPTAAAGREITATRVYVNLATPDAATAVAAGDVDGVGLLRAEFMITTALDGLHPAKLLAQGRRDEYVAKMADGVAAIAAAFGDRPVVYRAIDLRSNEFAALDGGEVEPDEDNPMIGYRGCFRYVREPELFRLDLDVLHTVRAQHPNVHLMIPFVRTKWELAQCLALLDEHPLGADSAMKRWIMAEVPSAAYWIPEYARLGIDGVSIGSNDLTQLVLGVDRDSETCKDLFNTMDPAVLDTIDTIIDRATAAGLTTSLCGQAVSIYPELAEHLVRRGITSVSVTPDVAERTRHNVAVAEKAILLDAARRG